MLRVNFHAYSLDKYKMLNNSNINADSSGVNQNIRREIYVTWKYDSEGNIVYYTYDKNTGELIDKQTYKNPAQNIINFQNKI